MTTITIQFPDDIFASVAETSDAFARESRQAAAVEWYREGRVSQGRGAEIAGLSRWEFMLALSRVNVEVIQFIDGEFDKQIGPDHDP